MMVRSCSLPDDIHDWLPLAEALGIAQLSRVQFASEVRLGMVRAGCPLFHTTARERKGIHLDDSVLLEGFFLMHTKDAFRVVVEGTGRIHHVMTSSDEWFEIEGDLPTLTVEQLLFSRADLEGIHRLNPVPADPLSTDPPPAVPPRRSGREPIALQEAEDAALKRARARLARDPTFKEFWSEITKNDDTGTIVGCTEGKLWWTGADGRRCETSVGRMKNRLSAAKKRTPFKSRS